MTMQNNPTAPQGAEVWEDDVVRRLELRRQRLEARRAKMGTGGAKSAAPMRRIEGDGEDDGAWNRSAPQRKPREEVAAPAQPIDIGRLLAPVGKIKSFGFGRIWFLLCVVVPVIVSAVYLWGFASERYVSEFKFSVKSQDVVGDTSAGAAAAANNKTEMFYDTFVVTDYISSAQAVRDVSQTMDLRRMFSSDSVDWWSRLKPDASDDELLSYWKSRVSASFDLLTGTALVSVQGFSAKDAQQLAQKLLDLSERLTNETMARVRLDNMRFMEEQMRKAELRLQMSRKTLYDFRVAQRIVDPTVDVGQNQTLSGKLGEQLSDLTAQMATLKQYLGNSAPSVQMLESKIKAVRDQMVKAKIQMGDPLPGREAPKPGEEAANPFDYYAAQLQVYQTLQTELELSTQNYQSMMKTLEAVRQQAAAQHSYVLAYVRPAEADKALHPQKGRVLFLTLIMCLLFWVVTTLLANAARDHIA